MEILLKVGERDQGQLIEIERGRDVESLYRDYVEDKDSLIVAAMVNNQVQDLTFKLDEPCTVMLLDIRHHAADLIYQYSLTLLYICAVRRVIGKSARVEIQNSLNKGLYTEIKTSEIITDKIVDEISEEMRKMVSQDMPLTKKLLSRDEALKLTAEDGRTEKERILREDLNLKQVVFYSLDGYEDFFYGLMVPRTSYLKKFELRKYRHGVLLRFPHPRNPKEIPPYVDETKLYQAFGEQKKWDKLLRVNYVSDLNEVIKSGEYKELIQISEALHEKKIAEIADRIKTEKKRIVLIAGPSSSGKTTFAKRLCIQLKVNGLNPLYIGTDDYFVERENTPLDQYGEKDYESLSAIDIDLFNENMNGLLAGETVDLPTFDFITGHKSFGNRITSISSTQPIVIEGIHGLNDKLTPYIKNEEKFKIYISPLTQLNIDRHNRIPTTDERMLRRMVRDSAFRGHDGKSTIAEWPKVRAGEDKNIFPYSGEADVLFNSYHVYEIAVLKKYAEPLLEAIGPEEAEYAEAVRMLKFLRFFKTIDDDSIIVNNSIIREFIGGSIFV